MRVGWLRGIGLADIEALWSLPDANLNEKC